MNLKKLIEQIDEDYYKSNSYYLSLTNPEEFAKRVALEFGKLCFEAAKENIWYYIDEYSGYEKLKYSAFEDYLKSLENE